MYNVFFIRSFSSSLFLLWLFDWKHACECNTVLLFMSCHNVAARRVGDTTCRTNYRSSKERQWAPVRETPPRLLFHRPERDLSDWTYCCEHSAWLRQGLWFEKSMQRVSAVPRRLKNTSVGVSIQSKAAYSLMYFCTLRVSFNTCVYLCEEPFHSSCFHAFESCWQSLYCFFYFKARCFAIYFIHFL